MARLSRTQKYADLRDQLASDREDSVKSEDLNKYEDKLKSLEVLLSKNKQIEEKENPAPIAFEEPKAEEKSEEAKFDELIDKLFSKSDEEAPVYTNVTSEVLSNETIEEVAKEEPEIVEPIIAEVEEVKAEPTFDFEGVFENNDVKEESAVEFDIESLKSVFDDLPEEDTYSSNLFDQDISEIVGSLFDDIEPEKEVAEFVDEEPAEETKKPVVTETVVEEPEVIEEVAEFVEETVEKEEPVVVETAVEETKEEVEIVEEPTDTLLEEIKAVVDEPLEAETIQEEVEPAVEEPEIVEEVIPVENEKLAPVEEEPVVSEPVIEEADTVETEATVDYVNETLAEVNAYNKDNDRQTVEDISNSIIDELRHPENKDEETKTDEDFSNTVTLEIDKVLNEISQDNTVSEVDPSSLLNNDVVVDNKEPIAEVDEKKFDHPVLTKKLEEGEPEVIKTLDELNAETKTLDDTIPFVVNNKKVVEDFDEVDDSTPNKILNVILGVLIVVLLAILGVIVYYILCAKGIIS